MSTTSSFQRTLVQALTASESAPQCAGLDFDSERHRIVGEVPMAVRNLHNLGHEIQQEQHALLEQARRQETMPQLRAQLQDTKGRFDIVDALRWQLLREAFPMPEAATGIAILHDWQVAHSFGDEEQSLPAELREFLQGLGDGDGMHVIAVGGVRL